MRTFSIPYGVIVRIGQNGQTVLAKARLTLPVAFANMDAPDPKLL